MKRTPIHEIAEERGATFVEEGGWRVIERFNGQEEAAVACEGVSLGDRSARSKILLQGNGVEGLLQRWQTVPRLAIHSGVPFGDGHCYRLRHDRFFLSLPAGLAEEAVTAAEGEIMPADGLITVTDITYGRAELWLAGPAAPRLLRRLCGLDFHPTLFPNLTAKESSVAKTKQLVIRNDLSGTCPAYAVIGARSLGAYLWRVMVQAAGDLPFALLGEASIQELAADKTEGGAD